MDGFTGGCLCGDVRIVACGQPYRVGLCHCLDCRAYHGALFHASAIFPQDAVTITGETRDYAGRFFCPRCGSSVFGCSADEIEVSLGALDAPASCSPPTNSGPFAASRGCRSFLWCAGTRMTVTAQAALSPSARRLGRSHYDAAPGSSGARTMAWMDFCEGGAWA
ncbi:GFA family protein [Roseateles sp. P5_D6]